VAYSLNHCLTRAFYARGDTLTPMRIAMAAVLFNLTLNFTLIWPLKEAGLAWATAISASAQTLALLLFARSKLNLVTFDRETLLACLRLTATAVLMGAAVFTLLWLWPDTQSWLGRALRLSACVLLGATTYAAAAFVLRCPELRWLLERPKGPRGDMGSMTFE
jgi:putative peptidoglycan lipid II flippase